MSSNLDLDIALAEYKPLISYKPKVGDFIIWHGWFTHYYGIVSFISNNKIKIIKSGMPSLLITMDSDNMEENSVMISINKIKMSKGSYAIQQANIWYI